MPIKKTKIWTKSQKKIHLLIQIKKFQTGYINMHSKKKNIKIILKLGMKNKISF
jgi:hypothetical protein